MDRAFEFPPARTPRILWVELTSKCPFDCVFCSRKTRRGAGQHLPFPLYESLVSQLVDARKLVLNYSGESSVYPDLLPAIRMARSTGAFVEMVSAMASMPDSMLRPLSESGLNRLTVSVHAAEPEKFAAIYRYSSFAILRDRLERFAALCKSAKRAPVIDLAFVAMDTNLSQLPSIASFAKSLDLRDIFIFPVMRRDEIPVQFPTELNADGAPRPEFQERVRDAVSRAAAECPEIRLTICNESFGRQPLTDLPSRDGQEAVDSALGEVPRPYPGPLPPKAWIHSCEQNPWETAHVLSNGDIVACEVLDKIPLGNLSRSSMAEIWHGNLYRDFRERYRRGDVPECRTCPWKRAYLPGALSSEILGSRGMHAQLLHGWHPPVGEGHIWSSQQAAAVLEPVSGSRTLHISGMLPPGPEGSPNELTIAVNGSQIGRVENPWDETIPFGLNFPVAGEEPAPWKLEFRTKHIYRACERGADSDQRDLGFALVLAVSKEPVDPARARRQKQDLEPLVRVIHAADRLGRRMKRAGRRLRAPDSEAAFAPGLSVVIPERDNITELSECLDRLRAAAAEWPEPMETIVAVNGSPERLYDSLRQRHPEISWIFRSQPLGFSKAVRAGLRAARYGWVYLLNNDVALDPGALRALATRRDPKIFSLASQILLKDSTRYREETNWTALFLESGLAAIHDWIPRSDATVETFYAGGGASLFQTRLLSRLLNASVYSPFYWEDVEWGWRARKLGYRSLFCPDSIAYHRQRATIGKHYTSAEVEAVIRRNRILFQLRNFTAAGSLSRAIEEIAASPEQISRYFKDRRTHWRIAAGRIWNHLAPLEDEEVFAAWNSSLDSEAAF